MSNPFERRIIRSKANGGFGLNYFMGGGHSNYADDGSYLDPNSEYRHRFKDLINWVHDFMETGVLIDVGGGLGHLDYWAQQLFPNSYRVLTSDIFPKYDKQAKKYLQSNPNYVCASADGLPFRDESTHGVIIADVLEHLTPASASEALRESHRVLIEGGHLFVSIPNAYTWSDKGYRDPTHLWIPDIETMRRGLAEHGFVEMSTYTRGFPFSAQVGRILGHDPHLPLFGTSIRIHARKG